MHIKALPETTWIFSKYIDKKMDFSKILFSNLFDKSKRILTDL